MANKVANADNRLYQHLINLKRHLMKCRDCRGALKGNDPHSMCPEALMYVIGAAKQYDITVQLRIDAHNGMQATVFPCPKLSAHGQAYELTALPVVVIGSQDRLF